MPRVFPERSAWGSLNYTAQQREIQNKITKHYQEAEMQVHNEQWGGMVQGDRQLLPYTMSVVQSTTARRVLQPT